MGGPLENTLCESVMNACLLKIAADEVAELAGMTGRDAEFAARIAKRTCESMQRSARKGDFFARCLINDGWKYTYLGAEAEIISDGTRFRAGPDAAPTHTKT